MEHFSQERNLQSEAAEMQRAREYGNDGERNESGEMQRSENEYFKRDEYPRPNATGKKEKGKSQKQTQTLAGMASVIAASVIIVASASVPQTSVPPAFEMREEIIGLSSYEATLDLQRAEGLDLTVQLYEGEEIWQTTALEENVGSIPLFYRELLPETTYTVCVSDDTSRYFSHTFTTDPFVEFAEFLPTENKTAFTLHEELTGADVGLDLFGVEGLDFNSNILFDPEGTNYLYTDGLFAGNYVFTATVHIQDDPFVYEKMLSLGTLTAPAFTAKAENGILVLTLTEGELGSYLPYGLEFETAEYYENISADQIGYENGVLTAPLPDGIVSGTYALSLSGEMETADRTLINEIWQGGIELMPATVTQTQETVGLTSYDTMLSVTNPSGIGLTAVLTASGEEVSATVLDVTQSTPVLSFPDLTPETEYVLHVLDGSRNAVYTQAFTTQAFVTIGQEANGQIPFSIHESFVSTDVGVELLSSTGLDYSGNLTSSNDTEGVYGIRLDGLFEDTYTLRISSYGVSDPPDVYEKTLNLGTGVSPAFTVTAENGTIVLTLAEGELGVYGTFELDLEQDGIYKSIPSDQIGYENGVMNAPVPAELTSGTYRIVLWGVLEADGGTAYNQIWAGEITITV